MTDDLKPAYLLAGTDRPKVDRALQRLRQRFAGDAIELYAAAETSGPNLVAACNALGLFAGDGRLIVVDGVEEWKADDVKAIGAYLKAPAPGTTVAFVAGELKKDAPLAKAVAASGELLLWDVAKNGRQSWVAEQFKLHGVSAEPEACRSLLELVGDDPYDLAMEVDKLATWAAGERVTAADVAEPRSRTIPRIAAILGTHVARVRSCQILEAEGLSSKDAAARLKQHPFYVQKLYAHARNWSPEELRQVTVRLADLDHALKGGSRLPDDLELERALVELTRTHDRDQAVSRA